MKLSFLKNIIIFSLMAQTTPTIHAVDRVSVSAESKYVATV